MQTKYIAGKLFGFTIEYVTSHTGQVGNKAKEFETYEAAESAGKNAYGNQDFFVWEELRI